MGNKHGYEASGEIMIKNTHLAVYAGSFDPWHLGHDYVHKAAKNMFDHVIIVKANNPDKQPTHNIVSSIPEHSFLEPNVALGLMCKNLGACTLVRGVRVASDYDYEFRMAAFNREKFGISTIFIPCPPHLSHISSSALRQLHALGQTIAEYLPHTGHFGAPACDIATSAINNIN